MSTHGNTTDSAAAAQRIRTALVKGAAASALEVETALRACTRERLLELARDLGLKGTAKLAKDPLVARVSAALATASVPAPSTATTAATATPSPDAQSVPALAKFDLGPGATDAPTAANIPWGYGADRVTAMVIDPRHLFVYWELTDAAIETARRALGPSGAGAWLNLRVYDITGRLFDGTNAHGYFDEGVSRDDRQWFFEIGKPTSTACIELGLKSSEGYFVKISRSGRVDFPRDAPAGDAPIEWLTVRSSTGHAGDAVVGGAPIPDATAHGVGLGVGVGILGGHSADDWQGWSDEAGFPVPGGVVRETDGGWEWREVQGQTPGAFTTELGALEWTGPLTRSEWQAGPFNFPVDAPALLEQSESGEVSMRVQDGVAHVVYGPWQVVIRGAAAHAERRVLATWEYRRTIEVAGGVEMFGAQGQADGGRWESIGPGASEWRFVPGGSSERRWAGASELLVRGGSEVFMVGASERRFRGASERLYTGASERRLRGASERLQRGASERRLGGSSEKMYAGREAAVAGGGPVGASENVARTAERDGAASAFPKPERSEPNR